MRKITLMIVDSQPFFRSGVRQALSQGNNLEAMDILECDPGEDGNEAIRQITANSPDIVLIDIGYPFLNGLEMGKKIARSFPGTGVVILSTNPDEDDDELFEVIKIGAVAYLRSKHCSPTELLETIKRASSGEYPINECVSSKPKVAWRVLRQFQDMASMGRTLEDITTPLTPKEVQILTHIAEGNSNKRIANILGISEQTIKNHVSAILRKLNANDRAHAVFIAIRNGLISIQIDQSRNRRGEGVSPAQLVRR
ncbi:MAG: response regulator transcription factor [Dehalococcoidia bacterium]|nr:response regulator transcription factor [Dehalococcoidia bacterium]